MNEHALKVKWRCDNDSIGVAEPVLNALAAAIREAKIELEMANSRTSPKKSVDELCDELLDSLLCLMTERPTTRPEDNIEQTPQQANVGTLRPNPARSNEGVTEIPFSVDSADALLFYSYVLSLVAATRSPPSESKGGLQKHRDPTANDMGTDTTHSSGSTLTNPPLVEFSNFVLLKWCAAVATGASRYGLTL